MHRSPQPTAASAAAAGSSPAHRYAMDAALRAHVASKGAAGAGAALSSPLHIPPPIDTTKTAGDATITGADDDEKAGEKEEWVENERDKRERAEYHRYMEEEEARAKAEEVSEST